jgi:hypothetical protein
MAEAEQQRVINITIPPSQTPLPPIAANACLINHTGQTFVLDFGFADPLVIAAHRQEEGNTVAALHVGRIVIARDVAEKLRDQLARILGAP